MKIYNTFSKTKEAFKPVSDKVVNFYYCGITVYDFCHIGHARTWVAFDVIRKYLRSKGYTVNLVRNITDIDDKIIKRAQEENITCEALTERFIQAMQQDCAALGIETPTHEPRATHMLPQMIQMITKLINSGHAYVGQGGDVYFKVSSYPSYGSLGHKNLDELLAGIRVEAAADKANPLDFVLWKMGKPGEPVWDSPWGKGRPGWHIECSAMSGHYCGATLDMHGGGADLVFPHHENERAQSECANGTAFVNTWLHVGFVQMDSEKMSKSLGNFSTIRDVLKLHDPEVLRYFLLSRHYRSPLDFTNNALLEAKNALNRLYTVLKDVKQVQGPAGELTQRFNAAMDDDFNTPEAMAVLFDAAHTIQREGNGFMCAELFKCASILGILQGDPVAFLQQGATVDTAYIEAKIAERLAARAAKNFAVSDQIRDELASKGIILEDAAGGTTWRSA